MRGHFLLASVVAILSGAFGAGAVYYGMGKPPELPSTQPEASDGSAHEEGHHGGEAHRDEHEHEEGVVAVSEEAIREFGLRTAPAAGGVLEKTLSVPVEIALNADRVAHIVPRVAGTVREVRRKVGDQVGEGEVLAVLESRELAEAKTADLAAEAKLELARANFERQQSLRASNSVSEKTFLESKQQLAEAQIEHRSTDVRLHAFGVSHDEIARAASQEDGDFARYEIRAPFAGAIVEKHIALGEVVGSSDVFLIADLSNVWAEVTIYPRDAARVRVGSTLRLAGTGARGEPTSAEAQIAYVSPIIREATRTAYARAVIPNPNGQWRPGEFLTGEIVIDRRNVGVLVPNDAVQTLEGQSVVFVQRKGGAFEKRPVAVGESNSTHSEIRSGLKPGEACVVGAASLLKAELAKGEGGHEH